MRSLTVALMVLVTGVGCADQTKVAELETKLASLELAHTELQSTVNLLDVRMNTAETDALINALPKTGSFSVDDSGFSTIYSDLGHFLVSLQNVKPYANGYKATFHLGNPHAVNFLDAELEL